MSLACAFAHVVNSCGKHIKYLPHKTIFNWASAAVVVVALSSVSAACFRLLFSHCMLLSGRAKNHLAVVFILP